MAGNFSVEARGTAFAITGIRARAGVAQAAVKRIAEEAGDIAMTTMIARIPEGETGDAKSRIRKAPAMYRPGGAGGGGEWWSIVGLTEGEVNYSFLLTGTGEDFDPVKAERYNIQRRPSSNVVGGKIYSSTRNVMPIRGGFARWQTGMEPKDLWYRMAIVEAREFVAASIKTLDIASQ